MRKSYWIFIHAMGGRPIEVTDENMENVVYNRNMGGRWIETLVAKDVDDQILTLETEVRMWRRSFRTLSKQFDIMSSHYEEYMSDN